MAVAAGVLLLAACGSGGDESIEPVPQATAESANALMTKAEQAAGNAQARMGAEAKATNNVEARR